jgi:hypothetical protein
MQHASKLAAWKVKQNTHSMHQRGYGIVVPSLFFGQCGNPRSSAGVAYVPIFSLEALL